MGNAHLENVICFIKFSIAFAKCQHLCGFFPTLIPDQCLKIRCSQLPHLSVCTEVQEGKGGLIFQYESLEHGTDNSKMQVLSLDQTKRNLPVKPILVWTPYTHISITASFPFTPFQHLHCSPLIVVARQLQNMFPDHLRVNLKGGPLLRFSTQANYPFVQRMIAPYLPALYMLWTLVPYES